LVLDGLLALFGWAVFFLAGRTDPRHLRAMGACLVAIGSFSLFLAFHGEAAREGGAGPLLFLGAFATFWLLGRLERTEAP
jgi:hypothetical protein